MPTLGLCHECGAELAADTPHGLCAQCLFGLAMGNQDMASSSTAFEFLKEFGDYELVEEIARGGMGVVYKARQKSVRRTVALKMILAGPFASEIFITRFRTEAEAAANLDHPNIVPIHEVGERDGQHYFTMKLVEGGNLAQFLSTKTQTVAQWAELMVKIARAVHYAHQHGVLHRDLKPSNILLDHRGEPHVTDFGLAKLLEEETGLTQSDVVIGTASYMSPEQANGQLKNLSTASDIYSLGAIFYEMLTGRPPFKAESTVKLLRDVIEKEPESPRALNRSVDADLETICLKCLEKQPDERYGSAAAFAADVERWLKNEVIEARPATTFQRVGKWVRRRPAVAALGAISLLLLMAAVVILTLSTVWISASRDKLRKSLYVSETSVAHQSHEAGNVEHTRRLLENQRPRAGQKDDLRGFEWRRLWGISRPQEDFVISTPDELWSVALSPDGQMLAAGSSGPDGSVRLWDARSRKEIATLTAPGGAAFVDSISFSPDGQEMACSYRLTRRIRIWDLAARTVRMEITNFSQQLPAVAYSPDGKRLVGVTGQSYASGLPGEARQFDAATGELVGDLPGVSAWLMRVAFSSDGRWIAAGGGQGVVMLWDTRQGFEARRLAAHRGNVMGLALSPDGKVIATGNSDGLIRVSDIATGREITTIPAHGKPIYALAFSPDGRLLASGGLDHMVKLWDAESLHNLAVYRGHSGRVTALAFGSGGKTLISSSTDGSLRGWDPAQRLPAPLLRSHGALQYVQVGVGHGNRAILAVTNFFSQPITGARIAAFHAISGKELGSFLGYSFSISQPAQRIATRSRNEIRILSTKDWQVERTLPVSRSPAALAPFTDVQHSVTISRSGRWVAAGAAQNKVEVWDLSDGSARETLAVGTNAAAPSLMFTPDEKLLLVWGAGNQEVSLWECRSWQKAGEFRGGDFRVAVSPDGRTVACASAETIELWDLPGRKRVGRLAGDIGSIWSLGFSPDGRTLAAGSHEGSVKFWNMATLQEVTTLQAHISIVSTLEFSSDGAYLVTGSIDDTVKVWRAPAFEVTDARAGAHERP